MKTELKDVKAGDKVIVSGRWWLDRVGTVARRTATQITVGNMKFRNDGRMVGNRYSDTKIRTGTEEEMAAVTKRAEAQRFRDRLDVFSFSKLNDDAVVQVWALVESLTAEASK